MFSKTISLFNISNAIRACAAALALFIAAAASSCLSHSDEPEPEPERPTPQIIFLFSPGGLGDMSYNDCILKGIQLFKNDNSDIDIYIYSPNSLEESERIFSDWLKRPESNIPVLFALASSDYEPMAEKYLSELTLTPNKSILLFESLKEYADPNIHTFQISMYGASYLAGVTAAQCAGDKKSLVVLANNSDGPISVSRDGFLAGYGAECDIEYLADDWTGYVSAPLAYQKMSTWALDYGFIFPVAGGSNSGIYRYSREFEASPFLAGMDIDQSSLSTKITGSVIKNIDVLTTYGQDAEGIEGVAFGADPESGFDVSYRTFFSISPTTGEAQLYDAAMLVGYAAWYQQLHPEASLQQALRAIVSGEDMNMGSWTGEDMGLVIDALARGDAPYVRGASGQLRFDSKIFTNVLATTYYNYKVYDGQYIILDYNTSDGGNRTDATLAGWNWKASQMQDFEDTESRSASATPPNRSTGSTTANGPSPCSTIRNSSITWQCAA